MKVLTNWKTKKQETVILAGRTYVIRHKTRRVSPEPGRVITECATSVHHPDGQPATLTALEWNQLYSS